MCVLVGVCGLASGPGGPSGFFSAHTKTPVDVTRDASRVTPLTRPFKYQGGSERVFLGAKRVERERTYVRTGSRPPVFQIARAIYSDPLQTTPVLRATPNTIHLELLYGPAATVSPGSRSLLSTLSRLTPRAPLSSIYTAFFSFKTALKISCARHSEKSGGYTFRVRSKR